jgi:SNF2 family DNA or RNA helicase
MLNVRKLKQDFSSNILKEGKDLFEDCRVVSAKIVYLDTKTLRISAQVLGQYDNTYQSEIEIDRLECETIDSDCDCPYHYDCQHLAALLYYLEENLDSILVAYSKEADMVEIEEDKGGEELLEAMREAATKEDLRKEEQYQKQLLQEYVNASNLLARSPFFITREERPVDRAELAVIVSFEQKQFKNSVELQLAFRLPSRSKPLHIPNIRDLFESMRHNEPIQIGGRNYFFTLDSFSKSEGELAKMVLDFSRIVDKSQNERSQKTAFMELRVFGTILAKAYEIATANKIGFTDDDLPVLPCMYEESLENPLRFSQSPASIRMELEFIKPPTSKILINPCLLVDGARLTLEEVRLFECASPGMLSNHAYYRFGEKITRKHLSSLKPLREMTIPQPLFGTFIENGLSELSAYAEIADDGAVETITTLPYIEKVKGVCDISYLNGELEANLSFDYSGKVLPADAGQLTTEDIESFITKQGIVARNLVDEQKIVDALFQDFYFLPEQGVFSAKTEKKVIEFMTETIPAYQDQIAFNCPQNLLDQFIYNESKFTLALSEHENRMDVYDIDLQVDGALKGVTMDRLWECILSRRAYLELEATRARGRGRNEAKGKIPKILVLDLEEVGGIVQLFDELGIQKLDNHQLERPLWSIANIDEQQFAELPVVFTMTKKLKEIRSQMLGDKKVKFSPVPKSIKAELRHYQEEGVNWLERLRKMYLNGILADDMGLGKTLQAIVAITQLNRGTSLIVCPTSLLYNWKEEFIKFNPKLNVLVIDGIPSQRKRLIDDVEQYDVIVTSYSLLQKDIELYEDTTFSLAILDEAQHIKNRGTRNARSVKLVKAQHRMILSGTPIENSLEELWSLFDYLMPSFLGTFERFLERYIRVSGDEQMKNLSYLKQKVSPFILRRMKVDVLDDLPPISDIVYHTQLTATQQDLYQSYAASARDELTKLVARDGFDKVQIHVLATLTRLKQICCHPAIFAKDTVEPGDSAKYDMLLELLQTLIEGGHKTVIFSQYTRMLQIMRTDLERLGIRFSYLDGTSKNRLDIVKNFNEDKGISVFLVSLKAGGTGLNLVGADTVIHYDMWWNPAVENQATDRVYRIGQKQNVSVYKLVTKGTIEEKIVEMQKRKQGLVKKVVSCDDEAISKLTWEDVLELLGPAT